MLGEFINCNNKYCKNRQKFYFGYMTTLKGGLTDFFALHDCVYGVQYNMYSWFVFVF